MKAMRAAAAELRREAFAGLSAEERERLIDCLLEVKVNLTRLATSEPANGSRQRRRA
jgi:hypothetical protein